MKILSPTGRNHNPIDSDGRGKKEAHDVINMTAQRSPI